MVESLHLPTIRRRNRWVVLVVSSLFVFWAAVFIARTSTLAANGHRYFCLFDDAMISMRYADNLAHGRGLVWNAGERVEGYTNLLMTLLMAVPSAFLEKRLAVLAVQLFGVVVALGIARCSMRLADELFDPTSRLDPEISRVTGFTLGLLYYPLLYWTLMGMETGLVSLLLLVCLVASLRFLRCLDLPTLVAIAASGGLAFLTRADSVIVTGPLMALTLGRAWRAPRLSRRTVLWIGGLYLLLPAAQIAFRIAYYGSLAPVTYTLKLGGFPLGFRLRNAYHFLLPFLGQAGPLFVAATFGVIAGSGRRRLLALAVPFLLVCYQLAIGGDLSNYWRFPSPGVPVLLILALFGTHAAARWTLGRIVSSRWAVTLVGFVLLLGVVSRANQPFLPEILLRDDRNSAEDCRENVASALAIRALTGPTASVGVFMAGTVPYYSERRAIDFLGKNDPLVAALAPDLSGAVAWHGMTSVPGHNKYDLAYSIVSLRPTYIEGCRWGRQDVCTWAHEHYQEVVFDGRRLLFLRDSPLVDWRKARR